MRPTHAPPEAPPPGPPGPGLRRARVRVYVTLVTTLLSLGGAAMPVATALGFTERACVPCFVLAAALGGLGILAWLVVEARGAGGAGLLAWIAFPIALFSAVGMLPLLVGAVFPDLLGWMGSPDHVSLSRSGVELRLEFPRRMREAPPNLRLNDVALPPEYFQEHPGRARWRAVEAFPPRSVLILDLEGIRRDLHLGPVRRVSLNRSPEFKALVDVSGERFQPQDLDLPADPSPSGDEAPPRPARG